MHSKLLLLLGVMLASFTEVNPLAAVRNSFEKATAEKAYAEKLKTLTENGSSALMKAYNGASWALLAKHHINPYRKVEYLKKGLSILNAAVLADAADTEIRFLRFCIEENIPSVVPFESHIQADKKMLLSSLNSKHPHYRFMSAYLRQSKQLSAEEKKKFP